MTGERKLWLFRVFVLVAAAFMIMVGIVGGEHHTVFQKAVNICLECIGIG